jgi:hypothetical protein
MQIGIDLISGESLPSASGGLAHGYHGTIFGRHRCGEPNGYRGYCLLRIRLGFGSDGHAGYRACPVFVNPFERGEIGSDLFPSRNWDRQGARFADLQPPHIRVENFYLNLYLVQDAG